MESVIFVFFSAFTFTPFQRAKKVVSESLGLVYFRIALVKSVLFFPVGQIRVFFFFKGIQIT